MNTVIQEQSGEFNSVGGQHYPSRAIVREKLFSSRLAAEQSAICGVIIHCYLADVIHPNDEFLPKQILLAWEFDDGAMVFGAYEPEDEEAQERPWYADDEFDGDPNLLDTAESLLDCGIMRDGLCSFAGSEYCDWSCPVARRGM